jgi:hypothetical protein
LLLIFNSFSAAHAQGSGDPMMAWVKYATSTWGKTLGFELYAKRSSWGLGQQFFAANVKNGVPYKLRVQGELYAKLICGNESVSKLDFTIDSYALMTKADMGSMNVNYLSDATGLLSSADKEECTGNDIMVGGKKMGVNRIQTLGIRITKVEGQMAKGGDWVPMRSDGTFIEPAGNKAATGSASASGSASSSASPSGTASSQSTGNNNIQPNRPNATSGSTQQSSNQQSIQAERRRQQEEAVRQYEQRYQQQLQQISQKSAMRAQRDGAIMDGIAGVLSTIQKNKAAKGLAEDASARNKRLEEFKGKISAGGYELISCTSCGGVGFENCGQCKSMGKIKCSSCNGTAGGTCTRCRGTGKTSYGPYNLACTDCSGTGQKKCLPCSNQGFNICFLCHGRAQRQCYLCDGTGVKLTTTGNTASEDLSSADRTNGSDEATSLELQKQTAIDEAICGDFGFYKKPGTLKAGIDSVYYIGFKRSFNNVDEATLSLKLFVVYRYSDGSFPLLTDLQDKTKHQPQTNENGSTRMMGYFESFSTAQKAMKQMVQNAYTKGINLAQDVTIEKINSAGNIPVKKEDFWNN